MLSSLGASLTLGACANISSFGQLGSTSSPRILVFPPLISLTVRGLGHFERPDTVREADLRPQLMEQAGQTLNRRGMEPVLLDAGLGWQPLTRLAHYVAAAGLNYDRREIGASHLPTRQIGLNLGQGGQGLREQYDTDQALFVSVTGSRAGFLQDMGEYIAEAGFGFDVPVEPRRIIAARFDLQTGALIWARGKADSGVANPKRSRKILDQLLRHRSQVRRAS